MNVGDIFPDFEADSTAGRLNLYQWMEDKWAILFSHPADFTPVCTTELAEVIKLLPEFESRNVKPIALSCDSVASHKAWIADIQNYASAPESPQDFPYPIIDDEKRELAVRLNMLDKDEVNQQGIVLTCRAVFIIDANKKMRTSILYPASTGRNFKEIIRIIDSLQLTDKNRVATPVNWNHGDECMVLPTISNEEAFKLFPKGFTVQQMPSGKEYIRKTPCPE